MNDIYQTAIDAFVKGRIKETQRICKTILKRQPASHEALHLLAITEKRRGKYSLAIKTFNKALHLAPSMPMYWNNLGEAYREMGDPDKAIKCYRKAVTFRQEYAEAYSNWGAALMMKGDPGQAEQQLLRAVEINPQLVNAIYNLGVLYIESDSAELACEAFERVLKLCPDNDDALVNLACLEREADRLEEAQAHYLRALAVNPSHLEAHQGLGDLYFNKQRYAESTEHFRAATEISPQDPGSWLGLARVQMRNGYRLDAGDSFRRALKIDGKLGVAMLGLADAMLMTGDQDGALRTLERYRRQFGEDAQLHRLLAKINLDRGAWHEAEKEVRRSLTLEPGNAEAYDTLTRSRRFDCNSEDLQKMIELFQDPGLKEKQRASLAYSISRAMEVGGDYDAAFHYLEQANRCQAGQAGQGVETVNAIQEKVRRIESLFTPELIRAHQGQGHEDASPIFIVGLPRSGKTVVESLLDRHPLVSAGGELKQFGDSVRTQLKRDSSKLFPDGVTALDASGFQAIGRAYGGELQRLFKTESNVTNTLPGNFLQLGMIKLCLPRAKVIWIDREIRDVSFEMYRKNFVEGHEYAKDLVSVAEFALVINGLMAYWDRLLRGFVYKVNFEELVADPQTQIRGVLDFCGLEPGSVQEESGFTALPTPENAVGVWRPYERRLSPLFEALGKSVV